MAPRTDPAPQTGPAPSPPPPADTASQSNSGASTTTTASPHVTHVFRIRHPPTTTTHPSILQDVPSNQQSSLSISLSTPPPSLTQSAVSHDTTSHQSTISPIRNPNLSIPSLSLSTPSITNGTKFPIPPSARSIPPSTQMYRKGTVPVPSHATSLAPTVQHTMNPSSSPLSQASFPLTFAQIHGNPIFRSGQQSFVAGEASSVPSSEPLLSPADTAQCPAVIFPNVLCHLPNCKAIDRKINVTTEDYVRIVCGEDCDSYFHQICWRDCVPCENHHLGSPCPSHACPGLIQRVECYTAATDELIVDKRKVKRKTKKKGWRGMLAAISTPSESVNEGTSDAVHVGGVTKNAVAGESNVHERTSSSSTIQVDVVGSRMSKKDENVNKCTSGTVQVDGVKKNVSDSYVNERATDTVRFDGVGLPVSKKDESDSDGHECRSDFAQVSLVDWPGSSEEDDTEVNDASDEDHLPVMCDDEDLSSPPHTDSDDLPGLEDIESDAAPPVLVLPSPFQPSPSSAVARLCTITTTTELTSDDLPSPRDDNDDIRPSLPNSSLSDAPRAEAPPPSTSFQAPSSSPPTRESHPSPSAPVPSEPSASLFGGLKKRFCSAPVSSPRSSSAAETPSPSAPPRAEAPPPAAISLQAPPSPPPTRPEPRCLQLVEVEKEDNGPPMSWQQTSNRHYLNHQCQPDSPPPTISEPIEDDDDDEEEDEDEEKDEDEFFEHFFGPHNPYRQNYRSANVNNDTDDDEEDNDDEPLSLRKNTAPQEPACSLTPPVETNAYIPPASTRPWERGPQPHGATTVPWGRRHPSEPTARTAPTAREGSADIDEDMDDVPGLLSGSEDDDDSKPAAAKPAAAPNPDLRNGHPRIDDDDVHDLPELLDDDYVEPPRAAHKPTAAVNTRTSSTTAPRATAPVPRSAAPSTRSATAPSTTAPSPASRTATGAFPTSYSSSASRVTQPPFSFGVPPSTTTTSSPPTTLPPSRDPQPYPFGFPPSATAPTSTPASAVPPSFIAPRVPQPYSASSVSSPSPTASAVPPSNTTTTRVPQPWERESHQPRGSTTAIPFGPWGVRGSSAPTAPPGSAFKDEEAMDLPELLSGREDDDSQPKAKPAVQNPADSRASSRPRQRSLLVDLHPSVRSPSPTTLSLVKGMLPSPYSSDSDIGHSGKEVNRQGLDSDTDDYDDYDYCVDDDRKFDYDEPFCWGQDYDEPFCWRQDDCLKASKSPASRGGGHPDTINDIQLSRHVLAEEYHRSSSSLSEPISHAKLPPYKKSKCSSTASVAAMDFLPSPSTTPILFPSPIPPTHTTTAAAKTCCPPSQQQQSSFEPTPSAASWTDSWWDYYTAAPPTPATEFQQPHTTTDTRPLHSSLEPTPYASRRESRVTAAPTSDETPATEFQPHHPGNDCWPLQPPFSEPTDDWGYITPAPPGRYDTAPAPTGWDAPILAPQEEPLESSERAPGLVCQTFEREGRCGDGDQCSYIHRRKHTSSSLCPFLSSPQQELYGCPIERHEQSVSDRAREWEDHVYGQTRKLETRTWSSQPTPPFQSNRAPQKLNLVCPRVALGGHCRYGDRCWYIHHPTEATSSAYGPPPSVDGPSLQPDLALEQAISESIASFNLLSSSSDHHQSNPSQANPPRYRSPPYDGPLNNTHGNDLFGRSTRTSSNYGPSNSSLPYPSFSQQPYKAWSFSTPPSSNNSNNNNNNSSNNNTNNNTNNCNNKNSNNSNNNTNNSINNCNNNNSNTNNNNNTNNYNSNNSNSNSNNNKMKTPHTWDGQH